MKISYNWLKDYVKFDESPQKLAVKLTEAGFEVEELYSTIKEFSGVVAGSVIKVEKHPDADKLSVCTVTDGEQEYQVICGAPNVAAGQTVPFARIGAVLPGNFKIKKAKIRGVESFGMICSKEELGLEKSSEGIWALNDEFKTGIDLYDELKNNQDFVYDLAITPNRPDCLNIIGIAREIAAITGNSLNLPSIKLTEDKSHAVQDFIKIKVEDQDGCPRYACRVILGVKLK
ncbi:MAG: hypothetical protein P8X42_19145, partial [Calditrichaceae bacterium]